MPFSLKERTALLALKGVGATVIARLEQMGIESFSELKKSDVRDAKTVEENHSFTHLRRIVEAAQKALRQEQQAA